MDLTVVIPVEFTVEKGLSLSYIGDIFPDTRSDKSVLKPLIGALYLPLGLRRQRIDYLYITVVEDLLSLRIGLVGKDVVLSPERVPSLDKPEYGMGIHIVRKGQAMLEDHRL
jgi:hypothetical protein